MWRENVNLEYALIKLILLYLNLNYFIISDIFKTSVKTRFLPAKYFLNF